MSDKPRLPPAGSHDVGYGKPPKDKRFKKGQSGNPRGRPKGAKNKPPVTMERLKSILVSEAYREVEIQDQNGTVSVPVVQAAMRSLAVKAAKGQIGAQKLLLSSLSVVEVEEKRERLATFDKTKAYQTKMRSVLQGHLDRGEEPPEILPHPDDIELDLETGEVFFHGPVSLEDKEAWFRLHHFKSSQEAVIEGQLSTIKLLAKRDKDAMDREGFEETDNIEGHIASLKSDLEVSRFFLITTCLSIMRRWFLRGEKVTNNYALRGLLNQHVDEGTDPKRPKAISSKAIDWEEIYSRNG